MPSVIATLQATIAELRAANVDLRAVNARLEERVRDLETRVGQHSGNSSLPPSSDLPGTRALGRVTVHGGRVPGSMPANAMSCSASSAPTSASANHSGRKWTCKCGPVTAGVQRSLPRRTEQSGRQGHPMGRWRAPPRGRLAGARAWWIVRKRSRGAPM